MWGTFWRMAIYPNSYISQPAESVMWGIFFSHCSTWLLQKQQLNGTTTTMADEKQCHNSCLDFFEQTKKLPKSVQSRTRADDTT